MKQYPWILLTGGLLALAFAPGACGGGGGSGGAGGGTGGSPTTTSSSSSTSSSTSTSSSSSSSGTTLAACDAPAMAPSKGACYTIPAPEPAPTCPHPGVDGGTDADGGALDCSTLFTQPNECATCAIGACCGELTDCKNDAGCWACLTDPNADPATCVAGTTAGDLLGKVDTCAAGCCTDVCYTPPAPGCNPVTNEGCTAGQACDYSQTGYQCYDPPNDAMLCDFCSNSSEPFCGGTTHCIEDDATGDAACARFCCDDGDCGTGTCDKTNGDGTVGLCIPK